MEKELETIEESFDSIPEEVQHYVYSPSFIEAFKALCTEQGLSSEESRDLKIALFEYLAQITSEEELLSCVHSVSKTPDSNQKIISWIQDTVVEKVLSLVDDAYSDNEEPEEETNMASPSLTSLSSIQERLSQATIVTPTKRDYSLERATPPVAPSTPHMDIYREVPEE